MRVLLIDPTGITKGFNIGLAYLASCLISKGNEVKVMDINNYPTNKEKRLQNFFSWRPQLIGLSLTTSSKDTLEESRRIVEYCKKNYKSPCYYVAGGVGVTINPRKFFEENKDIFHFGVIGEGELTLAQLITNLESIRKPEETKGIIFCRKGSVVETSARPFIDDLDTLPFPNYETFDSFRGRLEAYPMMTSRGCPFQCIFCLNSKLAKRKWRFRSAQNVIAEIKLAKRKYSFKRFEIWDDDFALDPKRAIEICDLLILEKLHIPYTLPDGIRAANVTSELAQKLKESGCLLVAIGIQDGNPETYAHINTGESFADITRAIKILKNVNLPILAAVIVGLPHTTYRTTLKSMEFIKKMGIRACWGLATPFPGTALYEWVNKNAQWLEPPDSREAFSFQRVVFETPEFKKSERLKAYYLANMDYSFPEMAPNLYPYQPVFYKGENRYTRMLNSFVIVWKYNRKRLPQHTIRAIRRIISTIIRKVKEFKVFKNERKMD